MSRLGIDRIDRLAIPNVGTDINTILDDVDDKLTLDRRAFNLLPDPGLPGQRIFSTDLIEDEDGSTVVEEPFGETHLDLGSGWKQVSPAEDRSLTSGKIADNSISISTISFVPYNSFSSLSAPELTPTSTSPDPLLWYKDPLGFVYFEGGVKLKSGYPAGVYTLMYLGGAGPPPPANPPLLFNSRYPWTDGTLVCGVAVHATQIAISITPGINMGLGMIKYQAAA